MSLGQTLLKVTKQTGETVTFHAYKVALILNLLGVKDDVYQQVMAAVENQTVEGYAVEKHPKFEIYTDKAGEFRFRLKATNGQIIAVSEGYKAMASCMNGIESVKKNAVDAPVVEAE